MRSMVFAVLLLLLPMSPAAADEAKVVVRAGMAVYNHIVETETTIDVCRRLDFTSAASYEEIYDKYENEIKDSVVRIGFFVGEASRRAGIDEQSFLKALDTSIDSTMQTVGAMARRNPEQFVFECRALPKAIIERTKPFEPLTRMFPREMEIIKRGFQQ